ncbi:MAG: HAD family hydrolase [Verrucomicrobiia bacterium]
MTTSQAATLEDTTVATSQGILCLFDIDGTLLTTGGAGEMALKQACLEFFGKEDTLEGIEISGRTDTSIARQLCTRYGLPHSSANIDGFLARYLHHLEAQLPLKSGRLLPGVKELLATLDAHPDVRLALLTGNLHEGARIKLSHYGIWHYFPFGAFADDSHQRNELGPVARKRALEQTGVDFPDPAVFVIGDTPHDIACGRACGAQTIAVATGSHPPEELWSHEPDHFFDDFSDIARVLKTLGVIHL